MPEQTPPPDDQPTSPDLAADTGRPDDATLPLMQQPAPAAAMPQTPAPATPRKTYQVTRGVIGGAAAAVLLVGGLAGYAIGATVVANDGPERGRGGMEWRHDFNGPGGGMPGQGPRGNWGGGGNGFGPGDGQWSGPQEDGETSPDQTPPDQPQPEDGQSDPGSGT